MTPKNSKKRLEARAPAAAIRASTRPCPVNAASLDFMLKPAVREMRNNCARRCGSLTRIPCDFPRGTRLQARPLDQTQPLLRRAERIARSRSKSVRGFGSLMRRAALPAGKPAVISPAFPSCGDSAVGSAFRRWRTGIRTLGPPSTVSSVYLRARHDPRRPARSPGWRARRRALGERFPHTGAPKPSLERP